jgi:hypothetical protein
LKATQSPCRLGSSLLSVSIFLGDLVGPPCGRRAVAALLSQFWLLFCGCCFRFAVAAFVSRFRLSFRGGCFRFAVAAFVCVSGFRLLHVPTIRVHYVCTSVLYTCVCIYVVYIYTHVLYTYVLYTCVCIYVYICTLIIFVQAMVTALAPAPDGSGAFVGDAHYMNTTCVYYLCILLVYTTCVYYLCIPCVYYYMYSIYIYMYICGADCRW